jgi:hypothetical protein
MVGRASAQGDEATIRGGNSSWATAARLRAHPDTVASAHATAIVDTAQSHTVISSVQRSSVKLRKPERSEGFVGFNTELASCRLEWSCELRAGFERSQVSWLRQDTWRVYCETVDLKAGQYSLSLKDERSTERFIIAKDKIPDDAQAAFGQPPARYGKIDTRAAARAARDNTRHRKVFEEALRLG